MALQVQAHFFSILITWWFAFIGLAQGSDVQFVDASHFFKFGESLVFQVKVESSSPVGEVYLFIQPEGEETRVEKIPVGSNGEVIYEYDLKNNPMQPFGEVKYWYRVSADQGSVGESDQFFFIYSDNRFEWQELKDDSFVVHWTEGDLGFGQTLLNTAHDGLKSAQSYLPVEPGRSIDIYIYPEYQDLQTALEFTTHRGVAGIASPVSNLVLISAPSNPDQILELERQIPHELTHILQYQVSGSSYTRVPLWLLEGNASLAEIYPNSDYQRVLSQAVESNTLYPMAALCSSFPRETSGAYLAYAQSESFVRYIFQKYGSSGIGAVLKAYSDGLGCEEGTKTSLGEPLSKLEKGWQQETLGLNKVMFGLTNLAPYFALSLVVMFPFGLFFLIRKKS